jgi:hypothetical protein
MGMLNYCLCDYIVCFDTKDCKKLSLSKPGQAWNIQIITNIFEDNACSRLKESNKKTSWKKGKKNNQAPNQAPNS